jgi:transposase
VEADDLGGGKKKATRLGAHFAFVDESGFQLIPMLGRTWAPCGRTPTVNHRYRRDRISAISAITVSPTRRRLGLCYELHRHNIKRDDVVAFLRHLLRHIRGHVMLVWDGNGIHKGGPVTALCIRHRRLHPVVLPPYCPELNPDEGIWSLSKRDLANGAALGIDALEMDVRLALERTGRSRSRLAGCVNGSELPFAIS